MVSSPGGGGCQKELGSPLPVRVDGAPLDVDGGLEDLQAMVLQQLAACQVVLLPVRHHGGQPQLLLQDPAVAVVVLQTGCLNIRGQALFYPSFPKTLKFWRNGHYSRTLNHKP